MKKNKATRASAAQAAQAAEDRFLRGKTVRTKNQEPRTKTAGVKNQDPQDFVLIPGSYSLGS